MTNGPDPATLPRRPQSIIPPYMLEHISQHGDGPVRDSAKKTLEHVRAAMASPAKTDKSALQPLLAAVPPAHVPGVVQRTIYDARHLGTLPGKLARREGQAAPTGSSSNKATNEAYDYLGATYDFYWKVFQRDSLDNKGLALVASVHYEENYPNAYWDGKQMVFGDGDGKLFNRFTYAIDIVAHELTHGVTESQNALLYIEQSGALNESMSDVFGAMVKQYHLKQSVDKADWIVGAGLLYKGINGTGLRSMSAPGTAYDDPQLGKDPQPATMAGFVSARPDNGGVHVNSGIPNHAFYLAAIALGGNAWDTAGKVWYQTLCDPTLSRTANFDEFAKLTIQHAKTTLGASQAALIENAWKTVEVL